MDPLSFCIADIWSLIDSTAKIIRQFAETTPQAPNEFNSLKKELDMLTLFFEAIAEETEPPKLFSQRFPITFSDSIESARRSARDIEWALESDPGRIPDERKTWKWWSYHGARPDRMKRLMMDLTTKIQTLNKMIQLSYPVGRGTPQFPYKGSLTTFPSFPDAVPNPSPTVFVSSIFTFGLATATYYQLHKRDKYQDVFLIGGVLTGTAAGWLGNADIQGVLLSFLPFCILVSLILSSCVHGAAGLRWQGNEDNEALLPGWSGIENMGKESGLEKAAF